MLCTVAQVALHVALVQQQQKINQQTEKTQNKPVVINKRHKTLIRWYVRSVIDALFTRGWLLWVPHIVYVAALVATK